MHCQFESEITTCTTIKCNLQYQSLISMSDIFQSVLNLSQSFELQCPSSSHWMLRMKSQCFNSDVYICLFDDNNYNFTEDCKNKAGTIASGIILNITFWLIRLYKLNKVYVAVSLLINCFQSYLCLLQMSDQYDNTC